MNEYDAFTKPVGDGFHAMLRTAGDGGAKPIKGRSGKPVNYVTEAEALRAVIIHLLRYVNGNYVRMGEIAGQTAAEAEQHFKPILRQKGKARVITVGYKGQRQRCAKPKGEDRSQEESPGILTLRSI